jgi:16S rRNA (adenine1518-N6/adenine1519-N6)-dimethyltransferase
VDFSNVVMLQQDALQNKNHFHPRVLQCLQQKLAEQPGRRLKLAANLPYSVATPVISNLLGVDPVPVSMTVTIQKELADRMMARPASKDYGALSIWVQSQCDVQAIRTLPSSVFWPRPKVESTILQIAPSADKRRRISDLEAFHVFVRAMFLHRRKFLRSELASACREQLGKSDIDAILEERNLSPASRAEELDVDAMIGLFETVRRRL